jgi:hypothetical protein
MLRSGHFAASENAALVKRAKRKKRPVPSAPLAHARTAPAEDRSVLAVTVLWMLTVLSSLAAEVGALSCILAMRLWPVVAGEPDLRKVMTGALLLAASVTGVLSLAMTPLVWRLRPIKPPLAILIAAVLVGIAPLVTLVILNRWE